MHGKTSPIMHKGRGLFAGLDNPFEATRYHSLIVDKGLAPGRARAGRVDAEGELMVLARRARNVGVQFHPECLTRQGMKLIENFLDPVPPAEEYPAVIQSAIARAVAHENLSRELARATMEQVLAGEATPSRSPGSPSRCA